MRVFIYLLITKLSEIIGGFVLIGLLPSLSDFHRILLEDHSKGNYIIDFCTSAAVIPATLTAIFAAANYELTLSWSVLRRMSPVDVFSGRFTHSVITFIFSGAGWALILYICMGYFFPNARFEWIVPILKGISENLYNYFYT